MSGQDRLKDILVARFGDNIVSYGTDGDMPVVTIKSDSLFDLISFLKEDSETGFKFLTDICGIHYPNNELPLGVIYHLHNMAQNKRLRIKAFLPSDKPEIRSLTPLFDAANWMERETWDFFGIVFTGHPNLKRILNVEYLDFFPMRKEYPLEDPTRDDKDNRFFGR
jgi:NADH-quinone oxidoreductase subunit C